MRSVGWATGAITFVNALPTGIGAAAGVALRLRAEVEIDAASSEARTFSEGTDSPLVRASLESAIERFAAPGPWRVRLSLQSAIPPAKGLKSSSAVTGAIARAVAGCWAQRPSDSEVARLGADTAQRIGLSATGAFDDALAALSPGVHVTDNPRREELRPCAAPPPVEVVLWIPRTTHRPSTEFRARFRAEGAAGAPAAVAALAGRPLEAMGLNTALVEHVMGYDYSAIRSRLRDAGALAAGVSGMGPTLAALVEPRELGPVLRTLPPGEGDVVITRFSTPSDFSGGAA